MKDKLYLYSWIPVPGFFADNLISKVIFNRIREVATLTGIITDE